MITADSSCVAELNFELICKQSESTADLSLFPYLFSLVRYSIVEIWGSHGDEDNVLVGSDPMWTHVHGVATQHNTVSYLVRQSVLRWLVTNQHAAAHHVFHS
jgi:hypothetical protein